MWGRGEIARRVVLPLPVLNAVPCKPVSGLGQALRPLYSVRPATGQRRLGALRPQGPTPTHTGLTLPRPTPTLAAKAIPIALAAPGVPTIFPTVPPRRLCSKFPLLRVIAHVFDKSAKPPNGTSTG